MDGYKKTLVDDIVRLSFEFKVEPDIRKALTLEQIFGVARLAVQPDRLTREEGEASSMDADEFFVGRNVTNSYQSISGVLFKDECEIEYYMDDDMANNPDGTMTAAYLCWEIQPGDEKAEKWFRKMLRAIIDAQENLLLYGHV